MPLHASLRRRSDKQPDRVEIAPEQLVQARVQRVQVVEVVVVAVVVVVIAVVAVVGAVAVVVGGSSTNANVRFCVILTVNLVRPAAVCPLLPSMNAAHVAST